MLKGWNLRKDDGSELGGENEVERALEGKLDPAGVLRVYLLYIVFPLWLLAGVLDYAAHRKSKIEDTAGTTESLIHILMLISAGAPVMMGLLLEINSMVLAIMSRAFVVHDVISLIDGTYAIPRRKFTGAEQHIHSYMEGLPFMAVSVAAVLYWKQFLALFGAGPEQPRWELKKKDPPLSRTYFFGISAAIAGFAALPYAEELWRCARAEAERNQESIAA
jgi:hypothetical protein